MAMVEPSSVLIQLWSSWKYQRIFKVPCSSILIPVSAKLTYADGGGECVYASDEYGRNVRKLWRRWALHWPRSLRLKNSVGLARVKYRVSGYLTQKHMQLCLLLWFSLIIIIDGYFQIFYFHNNHQFKIRSIVCKINLSSFQIYRLPVLRINTAQQH